MTIEENTVMDIMNNASKAKLVLNHLMQTDFLPIEPDSLMLCYDYKSIQTYLAIAYDYVLNMKNIADKLAS